MPVPRILCMDFSNEIYRYLTSETWKGEHMYKDCTLSDVSNFRTVTCSVLETLLFMDHQYRDRQNEVSPHYSLADVRISQSFRDDYMHPILNYLCHAFIDLKEKHFYCVTDFTDMGFRPLYKEYGLFIIHQLVLNKEYYPTSFLLAVQRTCYLWLSRIVGCFEFRGTTAMTVYWGGSKPKKDKYTLYSCKIIMEYDISEVQYQTDTVVVSYYNIRLGVPYDFYKTDVEKSKFKDDQDFYDQLWSHRTTAIKRQVEATCTALHCHEDISDII